MDLAALQSFILPILISSFVILGLILAVALFNDYQRHKNNLENNSWTKTGLIGFISNFLDTLGIGSFATETAMFKFFKQSEDRIIPGTLNVANAIPTIAQAIIYTQIVDVEPLTLVLMLVAAVLGSKLGAGLVVKMPEVRIQKIIGIALLITAGFLINKALGSSSDIRYFGINGFREAADNTLKLVGGDSVMVKKDGNFTVINRSGSQIKAIEISLLKDEIPTDSLVTLAGIPNVKVEKNNGVEIITGNLLDPGTLSLSGTKLFIGVIANFILGALMAAGIGLYAPCMALVSMLGMSPNVAFPIMMGSCALLMPISGLTFIKEGAYNRRASFAISITGIIGVLIAAFIVKSLSMDYLRWLVVAVVLYTATIMLRSAFKKAK